MTVLTPVEAGTINPMGPERALAALLTAFASDPVIRWVLPDPADYLLHFPHIVSLLGRPAFEARTAEATPDGAGVALWVAPDAATIDEEELGDMVTSSVLPDRQAEIYALLEEMDEHHPQQPCWYLPFMGVDPRRQGRGLGGRLLRHGLRRVDEDRLPAYLEASTPRNRALYERHGFGVVGEIRVADSPPLWPMLRPAGR
jgi:GNAT superfamily N-acetyltransferase